MLVSIAKHVLYGLALWRKSNTNWLSPGNSVNGNAKFA
jgi:hypothetical protein